MKEEGSKECSEKVSKERSKECDEGESGGNCREKESNDGNCSEKESNDDNEKGSISGNEKENDTVKRVKYNDGSKDFSESDALPDSSVTSDKQETSSLNISESKETKPIDSTYKDTTKDGKDATLKNNSIFKNMPDHLQGSNKNIFDSPGSNKIKRESNFLQSRILTNTQKKEDKPAVEFSISCKLYYLEEESKDWIDVGPGEILVKDGYFYFVRNVLKTVVLAFPLKPRSDEKNSRSGQTHVFKREGSSIIFNAKSKKSIENSSFEIVERTYKASFETEKGVEQTLDRLK